MFNTLLFVVFGRKNFLVRTITTRTLLDGTVTVTLIPTHRPTLALLRQRLYRTSVAPLKLLHVIRALQYTCCTQTDNYFTATAY